MMQYYYRDNVEAGFVAEFEGLTLVYSEIHFFQPSPQKSPWHVQAVIDAEEPVILNFWPHKQKAQRQGGQSYEGPSAATDVIAAALHATGMAVNQATLDPVEG